MQLTPTYTTYRSAVVVRQKPLEKSDTEKAEIIRKICAEYLGIDVTVLAGKWRKREVVEIRQISMAITKRNTKITLQSIGNYHGGRDHSTVIHAKDLVSDLCETDKHFLLKVRTIQTMIEKHFTLTSKF